MRTRTLVPLVLALSMCSKVDTTEPVDNTPVVTPDDGLPHQGDPVDDPEVTDPAVALSGLRSTSGAIVASADGLRAYIADPDNGDLVSMVRATGQETRLALGGEPTRLVRVGSSLLVTLRQAGELVRVDVDDDGNMSVVQRAAVGAEPFDVIASRDRSRVYVTLSQEDAVIALDGTTLAVLGRWSAPGEPRWLTLGPSGENVFVAQGRRPLVMELDPLTGTQTWHALPTIKRFQSAACPDRDLRMRITGDMALTADGDLLVPALYADTELVDNRDELDPTDTDIPDDTDFGIDDSFDTFHGQTTPGCPEIEPPRPGHSGPYGRPADPVEPGNAGRFTPVMLRFRFGTSDGTAEPIALGTALLRMADNPRGQNEAGTIVRSYPSAITVGSSSIADNVAFVSFPGSAALVVVDLDTPSQENAGAFRAYRRAAVSAPFGLVGVARAPGDDGRLVGWSLLERQSVEITVNDLAAGLFDGALVGDAYDAVHPVAASILPADVLEGRRLFYAANNPSVAAPSSGVSCETCHADGRSDGFTWLFEDFPRNTPNLAGRVSDTLPITWNGSVDTVIEEVHATSRERMGGLGVSAAQAAQIAAYVDHSRAIVRPQPTTADGLAAVERGAALFERPDVGCATCHAGASYTDGAEWSVADFTIRTNTPTLRGIGGSAPYFHDGSATTLRDVLERARNGSMGNTAALSDAELDDLQAYLQTL